MAYVLFDSKAVKIGSPTLTVTGLRLSLSADAGDILKHVGARFLHVLWDADACRLALRPLSKPEDNAYKITYPKGKRGASFSAQSFLHHIHWRGKSPCTVPVTWNEKANLLEADLPKGMLDDAPARTAKKA